MLSSVLSPQLFQAAVPFYGVPAGVDASTMTVPCLGMFGADDTHTGFSDLPTAKALEAALAASPAAAHSRVIVYEGVGHAFMNADPLGIARRTAHPHRQDVVDQAWGELLAFFDQHLKK